jgi:DNA replication protein DnaC
MRPQDSISAAGLDVCPICEGSGLRIVREGGRQVAHRCECRMAQRAARLVSQARIPRRFQGCSLDTYMTSQTRVERTEEGSSTHRVTNESLRHALNTSRHFVEGYPVETSGKGLLFVGTKGLGKTHLSIGILRYLVAERGATGVFWEHKELMEHLRSAMFANTSAGAEDSILRSVTRCEVLVIDDIGDITPSDWSWDTTSYILNARYHESLSTIITTNLENSPSSASAHDPRDRFAAKPSSSRLTLGDRIGDRMWSRLQEMCVVVEMQGEDFRQKVKRASFA